MAYGIVPRHITNKLFERKLSHPGVRDLVAMKVYVDGHRFGNRASYTYSLLDYYDEAKGITAMGRTTAFTASAVIELLGEGIIEGRGVIPPERLGMDENVYFRIMRGLEGEGIKVTLTCTGTKGS